MSPVRYRRGESGWPEIQNILTNLNSFLAKAQDKEGETAESKRKEVQTDKADREV